MTDALSVARLLVGSLFLGAVTNAMLLGHWYLVQPGLPRRHLNELGDILGKVWPFEVLVLIAPTGMVSVLNGSIDDGWGGVLGWFWVTCALTTIVLVVVTKAALRDRQYSAVMAATGLLYLAILTAFGTDLVARAILYAAVSSSAVCALVDLAVVACPVLLTEFELLELSGRSTSEFVSEVNFLRTLVARQLLLRPRNDVIFCER